MGRDIFDSNFLVLGARCVMCAPDVQVCSTHISLPVHMVARMCVYDVIMMYDCIFLATATPANTHILRCTFRICMCSIHVHTPLHRL
jgi:hypothetical protein